MMMIRIKHYAMTLAEYHMMIIRIKHYAMTLAE
jgi:hypothetical protein